MRHEADPVLVGPGDVEALHPAHATEHVSQYIYTVCFFFIELKVFVNLTYLYLSEIKKQGLIFSVGMGHLIIRKKIFVSVVDQRKRPSSRALKPFANS